MPDDEDDRRVRRDQYSLAPVSAPVALPPPPRHWSDEEWASICRGSRPREMEDKWIAFVENKRLFLHRSWTGFGVYEARLTHDSDGWSISELVVAGDNDTYHRGSDAFEALFVEALIDGILLGKWDTDARTRLRSMPRGHP